MNNLVIRNLSHVMGSKRKSCSGFMKKNPHWNMSEVKKKLELTIYMNQMRMRMF